MDPNRLQVVGKGSIELSRNHTWRKNRENQENNSNYDEYNSNYDKNNSNHDKNNPNYGKNNSNHKKFQNVVKRLFLLK